jgi:hypothetical protein
LLKLKGGAVPKKLLVEKYACPHISICRSKCHITTKKTASNLLTETVRLLDDEELDLVAQRISCGE